MEKNILSENSFKNALDVIFCAIVIVDENKPIASIIKPELQTNFETVTTNKNNFKLKDGNVISQLLNGNIVLEGRLPKDNCYEVAASTEVLNKYYSFTDTDVKNFIGKKIKVLENEYEIEEVGYIYEEILRKIARKKQKEMEKQIRQRIPRAQDRQR